MAQLDDFLSGIPPVTRCYLLSAFLITGLCSVDVISPFDLYLNWNLIFKEFQLWRLITCFLFFGEFKLHVLWNLYMLMFYCGGLENDTFRGRPADFCWFLFTTALISLVIHYWIDIGIFLADTLLNIMIYVWCRRNPHARMGLAFFSVDAPYLPWVLAGISLFARWSVGSHLVGIAVGHTYFFFEDIYPLMPTSNNFKLFKTPYVVQWIFNQKDDD